MDTMRTAHTLLVVAALLGSNVAPARGQNTATDPRWLAYLGCWEPVEGSKSYLCVVPAAGTSAVDFLTVFKGQVTARERIAATGERVETTGGDCTGWRSAEWSAYGQRLYVRSENGCPGVPARSGTGVIAMSGSGQWLYIQSATVAGQTGLQVQRYRPATSEVSLPSDVADAVRPGISATIAARAAAAAPLGLDDVVEASRKVEAEVLEAWLIERAEPFTLDAKGLVTLADAAVPPRVIDLMVALSYPRAFAINAASREGERRVEKSQGEGGGDVASRVVPFDRYCGSSDLMYQYGLLYDYGLYDCTGRGYGYGYGNRSGWYPGGYPVLIVYNGGSPRPHGRVVNGEGYKAGGTGTPGAMPRVPEASSSTSSGSSSGSSSSSGSTEQRTAHPRPPQ
jgi:hypothetical protein